jgi:hypothetical protein
MQLNRELVNWAKETCLRLAEEEPPTVALDEAALLPFTGRYVSDMSIIDISPSGDRGLTATLSFPPGSPRSVQSDQRRAARASSRIHDKNDRRRAVHNF